ncbi:cytoplasmic [Pyrrhoderma noxium]|uniref:Cytoplasmic n=1 Tax=Pyrrhoderma noxium TaxID=2282107 RepID=A0A286UV88_9AGAM|nr:cytoplasmic [Pyrrhoderma noxium]
MAAINPSDSQNTHELLSNLALPKTDATITIRIIKSFEFRTEKNLVLHHINFETTTVDDLKKLAREAIQTQQGWKIYRNLAQAKDNETPFLDTLKLYTKAHGTKTSNLIINLDHDDWILDDGSKTLTELGFENETEISFFNRKLYEEFKSNPETRWD